MRDLNQVFEELGRSTFRRRFLLSGRDADYLRGSGRDVVLSHARGFVAKRLAPAVPVRDGKQTPMRGHPVFVAQHATATCCRGCLAKWHGISAGRELSEAEQEHVVSALARWLEAQPSMAAAQTGLPFLDAERPSEP
ncbi:DUF4186 domain-containing protein [Roseomonas harenae]|jgi:predicted Fe-S protein YdhL (DUF1289 family)|uniref:DUF4186 domain-containing protein n=1 Tax=Muricoccus harenae TaxID=2692566 RepID=UPI0013318CF1|nr:DUF4186 domain-containing protein [Roseomonas harenae]